METKRINEAVKNNPDKFPEGYIIQLTDRDFSVLRSKISTAKFSKTRVNPKGFSEKGLYMLATIIKNPIATQASLTIIETFAKVREFTKNIALLTEQTTDEEQQAVIQRNSALFTDIVKDNFQTVRTEATIEFKLSLLKIKHTVKKKPKRN